MAVMHYMLWGESEEKNRNVLERKRNRSFLNQKKELQEEKKGGEKEMDVGEEKLFQVYFASNRWKREMEKKEKRNLSDIYIYILYSGWKRKKKEKEKKKGIKRRGERRKIIENIFAKRKKEKKWIMNSDIIYYE